MVTTNTVHGYQAYRAAVKAHDKSKQLNIYFTGEKTSSGNSWCPDCNDAEPHVMKALKEFAQAGSVFLIVDVGNREFWKDMKNPFRLDPDIKVSVIPTLARWKAVERLDGEQCTKPSLLEMFFSDSDS